MELHIHEQNLAHYQRLIAESERDPARNEIQHNWLLKLLADEESEHKPLDKSMTISDRRGTLKPSASS